MSDVTCHVLRMRMRMRNAYCVLLVLFTCRLLFVVLCSELSVVSYQFQVSVIGYRLSVVKKCRVSSVEICRWSLVVVELGKRLALHIGDRQPNSGPVLVLDPSLCLKFQL